LRGICVIHVFSFYALLSVDGLLRIDLTTRLIKFMINHLLLLLLNMIKLYLLPK